MTAIDPGRAFARDVWAELTDDGPIIVVWTGLTVLSGLTGIGWPTLGAVCGTMFALRVFEALRSAAGVPAYASGVVVGAAVAGYGMSLRRSGPRGWPSRASSSARGSFSTPATSGGAGSDDRGVHRSG